MLPNRRAVLIGYAVAVAFTALSAHSVAQTTVSEPIPSHETPVVHYGATLVGEFVLEFDDAALDPFAVNILTDAASDPAFPPERDDDPTTRQRPDAGVGSQSANDFRGVISADSWLAATYSIAVVAERRDDRIVDASCAADGALRFLHGSQGALALRPTLVGDGQGGWLIVDEADHADAVGAVFALTPDDVGFREATMRFRFSGTLAVTPELAHALAIPELAGVVVGRLTVTGSVGSYEAALPEQAPPDERRLDVDGAGAAGSSHTSTQRHTDTSASVTGPDVIVAELYQINNYGVVGSLAALSVGTISCNVGDRNVNWISSTNQHPVIGQNMYRLKNDRFEQIGMSWLKHGFFAVNGTTCSPGCQGTNGTALGVNCSDPYSANLNGTQSNLGPRYQVNAHTGIFPYPPASPSYSGILARRLQVRVSDLDQQMNPGAQYFVEGQYILQDDAFWGTADNNASYRRVTVSGAGPSVFAQITGSTFREDAAIRAWKRADASVIETEIRVPDDGLFLVSARAQAVGGGFWSYEYAVYNMNVHRSAEWFRVPVDPNATIRSIGFHDVDYHSGEPFVGTDWTATVSDVSLTWSTQSYAQNQNANALRWGTLYNFRFETNASPQTTTIRLGLFRPGDPAFVETATVGPITNTADCNGNDVADSIDVANGTSADCDGDNVPDECEVFALGVELVATGLDRPVYVTSPPNDATRLFIVEQDGIIKIHTGGGVLPTPFLDMSNRVSSTGEQGLFSIAFDPNYGANKRFYVDYTNLAGDTVVSRFTASTDPNVANDQSEVILKTITQDGPAHNGGQLQFAPDGTLYVGMGDGSAGGDPLGRAQDSGSLLGKILRLDVNAPPNYIPADNPYTSPGLPLDEIWAFGVRNPWRFSFDRLTGDLYAGDVGESNWEEIDFEADGSSGGRNYGWRCMEGTTCTGLSGCTCGAPSLTSPILTYATAGPDCSVTGGYVYRGCAIYNLLGTYVYADLCSGRIGSFRYVDGTVVDERDRTAELTPTTGPIPAIVSFGEDADGELYIVSHAGDVFKIVPRDVPPDVCGNGVIELDETCDDGNTQTGDGCDALCQIEPGLQNDACSDAPPVGDEIVAFDTSDATTDGPNEPAACNQNGYSQVGSDIWYCYTATCTGTATISLCGSSYDTKLAVYDGCSCPPSGTPIACNDNTCGLQSEVAIPVDACDSYLIRIGGFQGAVGAGTLNVSCTPDPVVNDCNGNGAEDASDIACGASTDGNGNGVPDECETTGDPIAGGRLFDNWAQELTITPPAADHPLWVYRPDPISNPAAGAATWRCKECHGWDYKGVDGQYAVGPHRTGFPGVLGTTLEATDLFTLLREPPSNGGGPGVLNGHDYGTVLTDPQINDLVAFVLSGAIDDAPFISGGGDFVGNPTLGQSYYQSGGTIPCMTCHGVDGTAINFGTFIDPIYLGTIAQDNPWEMLHKIRFGQPAAPMPSWLAGGGQTQGAADVGRYIQLNLPTECVDDLQCDDGVACTVDSCGADGRCVFMPTDALCADDGLFCNGPEVCDPIIGCGSAGDPCSLSCDEQTFCGCTAPIVVAAGGRYIAITPQPSDVEIPAAFIVEPQCALGLPKYVGDPSGVWNIATLVDDATDAARLTPSQWGGTVYVTGLDVVPDQLYHVYVDCGTQETPVVSPPVALITDRFGDLAGTSGANSPPDGVTNFRDVAAAVAAFQMSIGAPTLYQADIYGCTPDQVTNFLDISGVVDGFRGFNYQVGSFCPGPCW